MKLTNGCAIFGDKNGPKGSGTYFSINKVMASLRAPSYANLTNSISNVIKMTVGVNSLSTSNGVKQPLPYLTLAAAFRLF